jgi:hypothetical protein
VEVWGSAFQSGEWNARERIQRNQVAVDLIGTTKLHVSHSKAHVMNPVSTSEWIGGWKWVVKRTYDLQSHCRRQISRNNCKVVVIDLSEIGHLRCAPVRVLSLCEKVVGRLIVYDCTASSLSQEERQGIIMSSKNKPTHPNIE